MEFTGYSESLSASTPSNQSRLSEIEYPLLPSSATVRTVLTHNYGASPGGLDDAISRVTGLGWNTGDTAGTHTVHMWEQGFLGLSMPVIGVAGEALGGAGLKLDRFIDPSTGDATSGLYQGFDRYGRITHQPWADGGWADFDSSTPTRPEVFNLGYGYSNHSDIETRTDERAYASLMDRDEDYAYDGLHRLVGAERGVSPITSAKRLSQTWPIGSSTGLDMLGNWKSFNVDLNGDDDYADAGETQTRTHNKANEITSVDSGGGSWGGWEYDDNGNLILEYLSETSRRRFAYDPWDRLVKVGYEVYEDEGEGGWGDTQDRARFTYYGLHQRATTRLDLDQDEEFEPDQAVHYYYDASWRLLERRIDADYTDDWSDDGEFTSDPGDIETHQYIWGTNYIDELVYYQRDLNHNGNFNDDSSGKHYVLRDRNYSVIGVATGSNIERVRYTPYGESQVQIPADVTGEGTIDVDDFNAILSAIGGTIDGSVAGYTVEADVNRDGVVDIDDLNIYLSAPTGSVPENTVGYGTGNIIGYAGYVFEEELGMYLVRHRWYGPRNGRWNTRDPIATRISGAHTEASVDNSVSGIHTRRYEYVHSTPVRMPDSTGLDAELSSCLENCARTYGGYPGYTREDGYRNCAASCRADATNRKINDMAGDIRKTLKSLCRTRGSCGASPGCDLATCLQEVDEIVDRYIRAIKEIRSKDDYLTCSRQAETVIDHIWNRGTPYVDNEGRPGWRPSVFKCWTFARVDTENSIGTHSRMLIGHRCSPSLDYALDPFKSTILPWSNNSDNAWPVLKPPPSGPIDREDWFPLNTPHDSIEPPFPFERPTQ